MGTVDTALPPPYDTSRGPARHSVRDRLTVLCLANELGVGKWSRVAEFLSGHGQPPDGRSPEFTQEECRDIYAAAVRECPEGLAQSPGADAVRRTMCGLKRQRLDEIREALGRNSGELAALASAADGVMGDTRATEERDTSTPAASSSLQPAAAAPEQQGTAPAATLTSYSENDAPVAPPAAADRGASADARRRPSEDGRGTGWDDDSAQRSPGIPVALPTMAKAASGGVMSPEPVATPVSVTESAAHSHAQGAGSRTGSLVVDEQQLRNWKKNVTMVWREISGHRYGGMFLSPIKVSDAPRYYEVIRKPLDLKTIKNRIRDEDITTTVEFYRDIMLMLQNALMYNAEDTEVHHMAMEILPDAQACIEQLLQTEAAVKQPSEGGGAAAVGADEAPVRAGLSPRDEDHDGEDSDGSVPAKRRRRVASERASKHLRA
ncbi:hypothetical protein H4R19_002333 [Coemansia spiralis]|nr:hypothetical protein H4R19_002333 [Coemansia spiralis]